MTNKIKIFQIIIIGMLLLINGRIQANQQNPTQEVSVIEFVQSLTLPHTSNNNED